MLNFGGGWEVSTVSCFVQKEIYQGCTIPTPDSESILEWFHFLLESESQSRNHYLSISLLSKVSCNVSGGGGLWGLSEDIFCNRKQKFWVGIGVELIENRLESESELESDFWVNLDSESESQMGHNSASVKPTLQLL